MGDTAKATGNGGLEQMRQANWNTRQWQRTPMPTQPVVNSSPLPDNPNVSIYPTGQTQDTFQEAPLPTNGASLPVQPTIVVPVEEKPTPVFENIVERKLSPMEIKAATSQPTATEGKLPEPLPSLSGDAMYQRYVKDNLPKGDKYDTVLSSADEKAFQAWKGEYAPRDSGADYDLRGAFKAGLKPSEENGHWPDTFKKPNHPTFSVESKFAIGDDAKLAGSWNGEEYIPAKQNSPAPKVAIGRTEPVNVTQFVTTSERKLTPKATVYQQAELDKRGGVPETVKTYKQTIPSDGTTPKEAKPEAAKVNPEPMAKRKDGNAARLTVYNGLDDEFGNKTAKPNAQGKFLAEEGYTIAVDPKKIPYGSKVELYSDDPEQDKRLKAVSKGGDGIFLAHDTGSAVKSMKASKGQAPVIDLYTTSKNLNKKNAELGQNIKYRIVQTGNARNTGV